MSLHWLCFITVKELLPKGSPFTVSGYICRALENIRSAYLQASVACESPDECIGILAPSLSQLSTSAPAWSSVCLSSVGSLPCARLPLQPIPYISFRYGLTAEEAKTQSPERLSNPPRVTQAGQSRAKELHSGFQLWNPHPFNRKILGASIGHAHKVRNGTPNGVMFQQPFSQNPPICSRVHFIDSSGVHLWSF